MLIAYILFKVIDTIAVIFQIEVSKLKLTCQVLKSGIYTSEEVSLTEGDPDSQIDFRIWLLQVFVWTSCIFIGKIVVFFQEVTMYKTILEYGNMAMDFMGISGDPDLQLVTVMIIIPVTFNSILFWI